jgi:Zn-dependent protease with chaperone function
MAMTQEHFEALVANLEDQAARNPGLYKLKLGAFASLGYVYIVGIVLLLTGAVAGLGYAVVSLGSGGAAFVKIAIPVLALLGIVLKALWVKLDAPTGLEMKPAERRRLFTTIEEVRKAAKAPPVHTVLLTNELNAAVVQVPRLGMLGWPKNYLILGLPLMQLMTLDEFKAVLAHEFGHLSGAHGRFGAWIYRVRESWARLNERLQQEEHWGSFLFVPFFGWFAPNFAAYSFVQARNQEYEADRVAAEVIGPGPLATALIRLDLKGRELSQVFWPSVYAKSAHEQSPSAKPFTHLAGRERRGFLAQAPEHLKQALRRSTDTADTHPCLSERIAAIRQPARLPPVPEHSAAEALFGGALPFLADHFDTEWREAVGPWWSEQHAHVSNGREKLASFQGKATTTMSDDELFTLAQLTEEFDSPERSYPLYLELAKRPSRPIGARFAVGRLLLQKGDERGKQVIDKIIMERPDAVIPACEIMMRYLQSHGRAREAKPYVDRYWQKRNADAQADEERYTLRASDKYLPADMSAESLARIKAVLAGHRRVKRGYIARKPVPADQPPLYVIGVQPAANAFRSSSRQADRELVQELANAVAIPEDTLFIPLNEHNRKFRKVLARLEGARIH